MQAGEFTNQYSHYNLQNPDNINLHNSPIMPFSVIDPSNSFYNLHTNPQYQEFNMQTPCFRSNSTSDEADEQQLSIINERKQRRMISNRESARRSRMRKQKRLDELWSQVVWLRNENHQLFDKLNKFSGIHDEVVQENAKLKEEASELRKMVTDWQINGTYPSLRDLDDISNPSISSSSDFF
ncbi:basic leucine zipper 43-like [Bidens hawaiensis]|uniref:basic leucine zipper 43-like n=1 Tax=Bidens hawaiensis TaxID=980011 RepID=UPI00404AC172